MLNRSPSSFNIISEAFRDKLNDLDYISCDEYKFLKLSKDEMNNKKLKEAIEANRDLLLNNDDLLEQMINQIVPIHEDEALLNIEGDFPFTKYSRDNKECHFNISSHLNSENEVTAFDNLEKEVTESAINYELVLSVSAPRFIFDCDFITEKIPIESECLITDSRDGKHLNLHLIWNDERENISSDHILKYAVIELTIKYFDPKYLWETYIAESYIFYTTGRYKLAFLHLFIALDSLIEYASETLRQAVSYLLFGYDSDYLGNFHSIVEYMSKSSTVKNEEGDDIQEVIDKYLDLLNKRRLFNDKFIDIIKASYYIKFHVYKDKFKNYEWIKNEPLKKLKYERNALAHGSSSLENEAYQEHYIVLLIIIFELLYDLTQL